MCERERDSDSYVKRQNVSTEVVMNQRTKEGNAQENTYEMLVEKRTFYAVENL
jgi:hypothetical protein